MSPTPAVAPPASDRGAPRPPRRTRWRAPRPARRAALAYAAGAAAAALAVHACSDGARTDTPTAPRSRTEAPRPAGVTDPPGTPATSRAGTKAPAHRGDAAWVGALHNRGLDAVLARARAAGVDHRASAKTRCTLVGRFTAEFLVAERTGDARLHAPARLGDDELARLARDAACGAAAATRRPLADAAAALGERRADLSGGSNISPEASTLINRVDQAVQWMGSAAGLSQDLDPVAAQVAGLADPLERSVLESTIATARASAFYHEQLCLPPGACGRAEPPPPDATGAPAGRAAAPRERRAGVIADVVKADTWGCFWGAVRGGYTAGPEGAFAGCLWGGIGGSGGAIFRYLM